MKKIAVSVVLTLVVIVLSMAVCFAQNSIVECPDVKIVIDGKLTTYDDVPLSVNQRTMLPLRALLVNLGVPNDDKHIIWNSTEKSVTILKESTKIYLKQGSDTAYVNDAPITLDVAPMGYSKNSRTYIPARFVAQTLGKKVVWDGSSKSVLIRDEGEFNKVKEILDKSDAVMNAVSKVKFGMVLDAGVTEKSLTMNISATAAGEIDQEKKNMHMNMDMGLLGMSMKTEYYMADGVQYIKNPLTDAWEKQIMTKNEYEEAFKESGSTTVVGTDDSLCAGLVISQSSDPDGILLKGDVYLDELFNKANKTTNHSGEMEVKKFYMEVSIDKSTNYMKKIYMEVVGDMTSELGVSQLNMKITMTFDDYNGKFDVVVPESVKKNAVESNLNN